MPSPDTRQPAPTPHTTIPRGGSPYPPRANARVPRPALSGRRIGGRCRSLSSRARRSLPAKGGPAEGSRRGFFPPVLLALALLLAGCTSEPGGESPTLLPEARGPFRRVTPVTRYAPGTLHEYINGQAPYVVSFGMQGLATADYAKADEPVTTVDVYDMGSPENAFALFRSNADLEGSPVDVGTEGAGAGGRVEFWQDRYYVVVSNPLAADPAIVRDVAARLAADLPAPGPMPAYLGWLPADGRVAKSEQYLPEAYLGYEPLARAVTARFDAGQGETPAAVTLFACRYDSADAAAAALAEFKKQVAAQSTIAPLDADSLKAIQAGAEAPGAGAPGATGGLPASASGDAEAPGAGTPGSASASSTGDAASQVDGFIADKFVMGQLVIFRSGTFLAGILPYSGSPASRDLLARLAKHVKAL